MIDLFLVMIRLSSRTRTIHFSKARHQICLQEQSRPIRLTTMMPPQRHKRDLGESPGKSRVSTTRVLPVLRLPHAFRFLPKPACGQSRRLRSDCGQSRRERVAQRVPSPGRRRARYRHSLLPPHPVCLEKSGKLRQSCDCVPYLSYAQGPSLTQCPPNHPGIN